MEEDGDKGEEVRLILVHHDDPLGAEGQDGPSADAEGPLKSPRRLSKQASRRGSKDPLVVDVRTRRVRATLELKEAVKKELIFVGLDAGGGSAGAVTDFLMRCRAGKVKYTKKQEVERFIDAISRDEMFGSAAEEVNVVFAKSRVGEEKLSYNLMKDIITESKERGLYPHVGPSAFVEWAKHTRQIKREVRCFGAEVHNWLMMWKLKHTAFYEEFETVKERKNRMEEFNLALKDRYRDVREPLEDNAAVDARLLSVDPDPLLRAERPRQPLPPMSDSCISRRARYGMGWEPGKGFAWQVATPAPGTLASVFSTESPCSSAQQGRYLSSNTGIIKTSTSLPSLTSPTRRRASVARRQSSTLSQKAVTPSQEANKFEQDDPKSSSAAFMDGLLPALVQRRRYMRDCDLRNELPLPLAVCTGHNHKITAAGRNLVDAELESMGALLAGGHVAEIDLTGCRRLRDKGLADFLARVPETGPLRSVNLQECSGLGPLGLKCFTRVIEMCARLRELNLGNVPLPQSSQLKLCAAIGAHKHLSRVSLPNSQLGCAGLAQQCITTLLSNTVMTYLDLSWNYFGKAAFSCLGECLCNNFKLTTLRIASCAANEQGDTPIGCFIEWLAMDKTLTSLDASLNRIGFQTALVFEDCLSCHKKLAEVDLSQNPLGILGMRSFLRLLSDNRNVLVAFNTEGCYTGKKGDDNEDKKEQTFSHTNPGGRYDGLDLERPYHRSLLRMLYKTCDRLKIPYDDMFLDLKASKPPYVTPPKNSYGVFEVPQEGLLSFNFDQEKIQADLKGMKDSDFLGVLTAHYGRMRSSFGFNKVIPLFARWKQLTGFDFQQRVFLEALAKDFNLKSSHVTYLAQNSRGMARETVWHLMGCLPQEAAPRWLTQSTALTLSDFLWTTRQSDQLLCLNIMNPTGQYKLDLSNCCDFGVAERLLLLDRWEASVDRRLERFDTSARNNRSHLRSERYQGRPLYLRVNSVAEWNLPEGGLFEFDYVSNQRPPKACKAPDASSEGSSGRRQIPEGEVETISIDLWEQALIKLHESKCSAESKVKVLRSISHNFWITCMHMRQLIGFFKNMANRSDVFVVFFLRIVDMYNAKLFSVRFEDRAEILALQERLGYAIFFPFMQPENYVFDLDLFFVDERLCASMLVALSGKENPGNIREPVYIKEDGVQDPLPLGVPRSWAEPSKMPKGGRFSGRYVCAPEYRKFDFRKQMSITYGYYPFEDITDDDIQYWTGLTEVPDDVREFLEFLMAIENMTVEKAFKLIDGVGGNGVITLKEWEEGIEEIKCTKFDGKDKKQRLGEVFRYLDPGGEGSVSLDEWMILNALWKELELSIREFVQFLTLIFGDDLEECWCQIDEDNSGEMDLGEWLQAVEKIGYFGPARIVFNLLDNSDDGAISVEEFMVLEKYKPKRKEHGQRAGVSPQG